MKLVSVPWDSLASRRRSYLHENTGKYRVGGGDRPIASRMQIWVVLIDPESPTEYNILTFAQNSIAITISRA